MCNAQCIQYKFFCSQYNRKPANELDLIYVMVLKRYTRMYMPGMCSVMQISPVHIGK